MDVNLKKKMKIIKRTKTQEGKAVNKAPKRTKSINRNLDL